MNFSKKKSHSTIPTTIYLLAFGFGYYLKKLKIDLTKKYWRENSHQNKQRKEWKYIRMSSMDQRTKKSFRVGWKKNYKIQIFSKLFNLEENI